jgi:hypothetical protein
MNHLQQTGTHGFEVIRTSLGGRAIEYSPDGMHMNASLADFDINGTDLKSEHEKWLDGAIARVNASHRTFIWHIWINGGASMTGMNALPNNAWNYWLARQRAVEIEKYLKARIHAVGAVYHDAGTLGIQLPAYLHHAVGVENDNDRAVYVQITSDSVLPPRPRLPTKIPLSRNFAIRFVKGASLGAGPVGVDAIDFEIADTDNKQYALYRYNGDSVGVTISFAGVSLSYTLKGDWTDFHTSDALNVVDFDGSSRFDTGGIPFSPLSMNYLYVTPAGGATTSPNPLDVGTGETFGGGISSAIPGTGWLHFRAGPWPFSGGRPT